MQPTSLFFSFHRIICQRFVLDADFAPVDILANVAANVPALLLLHWTACGLYLFQTDLSWDVPANFFRHSGRLLCTDWNLDLSALIRCHLSAPLAGHRSANLPGHLFLDVTANILLNLLTFFNGDQLALFLCDRFAYFFLKGHLETINCLRKRGQTGGPPVCFCKTVC